MKYIIASDIHGSAYYMKKLSNIINELQVDKLVLLGDILYHGPRNPLPKDYNPMEVVEMLTAFKDKIIWIKGNCDSEVDEMVLNMKSINEGIININNKNFYLAHGHNEINNLSKGDYLVTGHTHINKYEEKNGIHYLNPGSISLPKENTTNSFILIEENIKCLDLDLNLIFEVK
ncbi:MAG: phosphodiesterase [bacterium]